MKQLKKIIGSILLLVAFCCIIKNPETVQAAQATVTFGSESYSPEGNGEFNIGVYVRGDETVGTYRVLLEYDNRRIQYIGGAELEQDGVILLEGTGVREQVKYMLSFRTISGGEAHIEVKEAQVNIGETENQEAFEVTQLGYAPIHVPGTDTVGEEPEIKPAFETDIPHIEPAIILEGTEYFLLDLNQQIPEKVEWDYQLSNLTFMEQSVAFLTNHERTIYFAYLFDETEQFTCYAYNPENRLFYPCEFYTTEEGTYYYMSPDACKVWPQDLTLDIIKEQGIVYAMDMDGNAEFSRLDEEGNFVPWDEKAAQVAATVQQQKLLVILVIAIVVIVIISIVAYVTAREVKRQKRRKRKQQLREQRKAQAEAKPHTIAEPKEEKKEKKEKPVISVQDVTMRFKVSISNVSGIKEYLIQLLKRQITYRELLALDHVSFDVYKGEVVGIIGTNGSGKSTVLRIVSGALAPTEGKVVVNHKKVQLLTLGTGFDTELTARENVYLNGAIIGYTKEFIDEHYDEIVAFAELEGFMEEKVKNFSSGMVSRLGFAIATVGEAAEILILDEVLSVGDEFFRKKSLKRVQEMIHGGSTVLMVSHSMPTILANCSKVVWIEKGVLKMVGEPKVVCAAYQKQHQE